MVKVDIETAKVLVKSLEHLIGTKTVMLGYFPEKFKDEEFMKSLNDEKRVLNNLKLLLD